jgi:hypothetical protein
MNQANCLYSIIFVERERKPANYGKYIPLRMAGKYQDSQRFSVFEQDKKFCFRSDYENPIPEFMYLHKKISIVVNNNYEKYY